MTNLADGLPVYFIDAFADRPFTGNPAAICPLDRWIAEPVMQAIAAEIGFSETAFIAREGPGEDPGEGGGWRIRWFTPTSEVDLCGHATLASAFVLFHHEGVPGDEIRFESKSGNLSVTKNGDSLTLNFPAYSLEHTEATNDVLDAIGKMPTEVLSYKNDLLLIYNDAVSIEMIRPDFKKLAEDLGR